MFDLYYILPLNINISVKNPIFNLTCEDDIYTSNVNQKGNDLLRKASFKIAEESDFQYIYELWV